MHGESVSLKETTREVREWSLEKSVGGASTSEAHALIYRKQSASKHLLIVIIVPEYAPNIRIDEVGSSADGAAHRLIEVVGRRGFFAPRLDVKPCVRTAKEKGAHKI